MSAVSAPKMSLLYSADILNVTLMYLTDTGVNCQKLYFTDTNSNIFVYMSHFLSIETSLNAL